MILKKHWFEEELAQVVWGQEEVIRKVWLAFFSGGHVLLEDEPGVGKTLLAEAMSKVLELQFARVQMTPDLLPMDLLGGLFWSPARGDFIFKKGPIFTSVLVLDELNRASPKTQSAVLQAMEEKRVSIDGKDHALSDEFFVLATQNPFDQVGTHPLPMSQLDRFALKLSMAPLSAEVERRLVQIDSRTELLQRDWKTLGSEQTLQIRDRARKVSLGREVLDWLLRFKQALEREKGLSFSIRSFQSWIRMAKFQALLEERDFVIPEDLVFLMKSALQHRTHRKRRSHQAEDQIVQDLHEVQKNLAHF
jgi:MoxR-like ATPase